ncbi:MAG: SRPBCC domain-containing protein [Acidimicrobiales bacterium]
MTVTATTKDVEQLTLTIDAEFDAPVARTWEVWADPRKLERWWGPPSHPATVVDHDLSPGGAVRYYMTSPEGDRYHGWWEVTSVEAPTALTFRDGFADGDGNPNPDMPVSLVRVTLSPRDGGGTSMRIHTTFPSADAMAQLIQMGMEEGMALALGQIDVLLG